MRVWLALKRAVGLSVLAFIERVNCLAAEAVEGTSLSLESVDDVHGGDGLALGVLRVSDGVADDVLEEDLQNTASLLVDETRDSLNSTTASETADSWLGNTLDIITQNFAMTFGATFSKALSSFTTT